MKTKTEKWWVTIDPDTGMLDTTDGYVFVHRTFKEAAELHPNGTDVVRVTFTYEAPK